MCPAGYFTDFSTVPSPAVNLTGREFGSVGGFWYPCSPGAKVAVTVPETVSPGLTVDLSSLMDTVGGMSWAKPTSGRSNRAADRSARLIFGVLEPSLLRQNPSTEADGSGKRMERCR